MKTNLNAELIRNDDGPQVPQVDFGTVAEDVECVFKNLSQRLVNEIEKHDFVFGCVAWLTHWKILEALSKKSGVFIVVQKEDFLRPDVNKATTQQLHLLYDALPPISRNSFGRFDSKHPYRLAFSQCYGLLEHLSVCHDPDSTAVRCVGIRHGQKAGPRCHHKFVVFADAIPSFYADPVSRDGEPGEYTMIEPVSVWTGSFNFTYNADLSFENAVIIRKPAIVSAYMAEFEQVVALSEPLDWESEYVNPEWRIGT